MATHSRSNRPLPLPPTTSSNSLPSPALNPTSQIDPVLGHHQQLSLLSPNPSPPPLPPHISPPPLPLPPPHLLLHSRPLLKPLPPLDHRLDIAPSPSPPPHLHSSLHHNLHRHHPCHPSLSQLPIPPSPPSLTTPFTTPSVPTVHDQATNPLSDYHSIHPNASIPPHLLDIRPIDPTEMAPPPPPPKKRERGSLDPNSAKNTNDPTKTMTTKRPHKKEKPAPVTMVYRGSPHDGYDARHAHDHSLSSTASVTALAPQTAINRGVEAVSPIGIAPPSTVAPSYSLSHATEASLMRKKHHRLRELCRERHLLLPTRELTKREMVQSLLTWRETSAHHGPSGLTDHEGMMRSSASEHDGNEDDVPTSVTAANGCEGVIDPQLCAPNLHPGLYDLRPGGQHNNQIDETVRPNSVRHGGRPAIADAFDGKPRSPQSQLANYLAATGIAGASETSDTTTPMPSSRRSPPAEATMSHPPMIPLLDDPSRNSKRRSIRLVGTKVPSIGPLSKMSVTSIVVGGNGPTAIGEPRTMMGAPEPNKTAIAPGKGTLVMKSTPPSPPASSDNEEDESRMESESDEDGTRRHHTDDLDVLLDLEDLKLTDKEIPSDKLLREQKVGSGSFKDVYMGRYRNYRVAICDLRGRLTDMDIKELGLLRDLRHPNIVRFIGVSVGQSVPCTIITELCRNGDLYDYIRKIPCPSWVQILAMMLDAARGVEYLHLRTPSIIHRDIKSPNVLITANGSAKITDFGLARVKRDVMSMCATTCGTLNWQAPELWVAHPSYNHSIDVYALGLVFWEVLCWPFREKTYPFQGMNEHAIFAEVGKNGLRPNIVHVRRKWGREIIELIDRMWNQDSDLRPTMPEVVRLLNAMLVHEREKVWAANNPAESP